MAQWLAVLLAVFVPTASAVTYDELYSWFWSPSGLDMSMSDAQALAKVEAPILTQCGVSLADLKALKEELYSARGLDLTRAQVKQKLLPLAKQHVDPKALTAMFNALYSTRGVDTSKDVAQSRSMELCTRYRAEPGQLTALFNTLYLKDGVDLPKDQAQSKAIVLAAAGCDATALKSSYKASKDLTDAVNSAIRANLNFENRRHAQDGKLYTAKDYQDYYEASYLAQWMAGVPEKRVSRDEEAYTASQFRIFFEGTWETEWDNGKPATQRRLAEDNKPYTLDEFVDYYKDDWQSKWFDAPELPCKECNSAKGTITV